MLGYLIGTGLGLWGVYLIGRTAYRVVRRCLDQPSDPAGSP